MPGPVSESYKGPKDSHYICPLKIKELKEMSKNKDLQCVACLIVDRKGVVSVVTYGETKDKCKAIGDWGQGLWNYAVSLNPFQTVFGWGNNGVPKP